jgi:hypothetical protein
LFAHKGQGHDSQGSALFVPVAADILIFFLALIFVAQAGLMISTIRPLRKQLERLNSDPRATSDTFWGFRMYRERFIRAHNLPDNFLFDRWAPGGVGTSPGCRRQGLCAEAVEGLGSESAVE